jgi:hypothetical protein
MNYLTIGILVIIIALCLYTVIAFFGKAYLVPNPIPLNSIYKIGNSSIEIDTSIRYYYEMWLWVDGNFPVDKINTIFCRGNKFVVGLKGSNLSLYYGANSGYDASLGTFTPDGSTNTMTIIQNFPFQKWTHFVLNVDSGTVDAYLDGKLVTSIQPNSTSSAFIPYGDASSNINIGNVYTQGKITRFRRPAQNLNPQQVWNTYMMGNGIGTSLTPYHINVQTLNNNIQQSDTRIF